MLEGPGFRGWVVAGAVVSARCGALPRDHVVARAGMPRHRHFSHASGGRAPARSGARTPEYVLVRRAHPEPSLWRRCRLQAMGRGAHRTQNVGGLSVGARCVAMWDFDAVPEGLRSRYAVANGGEPVTLYEGGLLIDRHDGTTGELESAIRFEWLPSPGIRVHVASQELDDWAAGPECQVGEPPGQYTALAVRVEPLAERGHERRVSLCLPGKPTGQTRHVEPTRWNAGRRRADSVGRF